MQKRFFLEYILLFILAVLPVQGCLSVGNKEVRATARIYDKPYAEVWDALESLIVHDLHCTLKKVIENKGYIETQWVHRIDTEGTLRWRIRSQIKEKKEGVWVVINKEVQVKDAVKKKTNRFEREKIQESTQGSGWKSKRMTSEGYQGLYQQLSNKLEH